MSRFLSRLFFGGGQLAPRAPGAVPPTAIYDDLLGGYVSDDLLGGDYILENMQ
jgi:hypothetical protein